MYRLVEPLDPRTTCEVEGQVLPAVCVIENSFGERALLSPDPVVGHHWARAAAIGAEAVLLHGDGLVLARPEAIALGTPTFSPTIVGPAAPSWNWLNAVVPAARKTAPFVHLHAHSEHSALDGLSTVDEMVAAVVADQQEAMALTDHGVAAGHPTLQTVADKAGIKPIFGIEAYFVDDRLRRPGKRPALKQFEAMASEAGRPLATAQEPFEQALKAYEADLAEVTDYWHLILWAASDQGLANLWALITMANREGFYRYPRMDWELLARYSEGVLASTACLRGPLADVVCDDSGDGDEQRAAQRIGRLLSIFPDRLYVELHTNQLPRQKLLNQRLVELASRHSLPVVSAVDSHYPCADDAHTHRVWLAAQTNTDLQDEAALFSGEEQYHMMTAAEVVRSLGYLPEPVVEESMKNTVAVADRCSARLAKRASSPVFSKVRDLPGETYEQARERARTRDRERLVEICLSNWSKVVGKDNSEEDYIARMEREMRLLVDKDYVWYFLLVADYCLWAKRNGIMVGPSRGSGGGCLIAYLLGITALDPVQYDLIFERFLTEGRKALPDFDVDFPASKREVLQGYVTDRYGSDYVMRVGTHLRLRNKGVIRDLARVLKHTIDIHYPDVDAVCKIIDRAEAASAGLGIPWDVLWVQNEEELAPYRDRYPQLFDLAGRMVGRLKSYGRHAAGLVISLDQPLADRFPMRMATDGSQVIGEFDMDACEALGLPKFDLLTLRTLDTLQQCVDLIQQRQDERVDVYAWRQEYEDPATWDEISAGNTLGFFQIETAAGTKLCREMQPRSIPDLADVITLDRPGPMRSGLKDLYLRRRRGEEAVSYPDPRLEQVLGPTLGVILYQEQVMATCAALAGYDMEEADRVRKILGKKLVDQVQAEGERFVPRCVERGMAAEDATQIWTLLAEFSRYSFGKAHAYGYAVLGFWCAYLRTHYPVEFLTAALSTVDKDRIPEFVAEARRLGVKVLPPDINASGQGFTAGDGAVRYGLDSIKGVGEKMVQALIAGQPYASWEDFWERRGKVDTGTVGLLVRVGAFDSLEPHRRRLEQLLDRIVSGAAERCVWWDDNVVGPNGLPCSFDWASEPPPMGVRGPLKPKPPPKRCTVRCRNYVQVDPLAGLDQVTPYSDREVREREMELLGVHLSSTPFDDVPPSVLDEAVTVAELEAAPVGVSLVVVGLVARVRLHTDRTGKKMAFCAVAVASGDELDVTCFATEWARYARDVRVGEMVLMSVRKTARGLVLGAMVPARSRELASA